MVRDRSIDGPADVLKTVQKKRANRPPGSPGPLFRSTAVVQDARGAAAWTEQQVDQEQKLNRTKEKLNRAEKVNRITEKRHQGQEKTQRDRAKTKQDHRKKIKTGPREN